MDNQESQKVNEFFSTGNVEVNADLEFKQNLKGQIFEKYLDITRY